MLLKLIDSPEGPPVKKTLTRVMRGVGLMEPLVVIGFIEEGPSTSITSSFTRARDNDVP